MAASVNLGRRHRIVMLSLWLFWYNEYTTLTLHSTDTGDENGPHAVSKHKYGIKMI